jgi:UDP-glucose 4-epimerase
MRALVTGSSGFLGSHILDYLVNIGVEVVALDIAAPYRSDVEIIVGDIRDKNTVIDAAKNCTYIFHNAAIANIDDTRKAPVETMEVNVIGTLNLLEAARIVDVKYFVFSSSVYVTGDKGSFYRVSKIAGELLCETYAREFGVPYIIARYGSLYGRRSNNWNMVYKICRSLLEKGVYSYFGTGEEVREFINVEDAAKMTVRAAMDEQYINSIVTITGQQPMKMKELFALIAEILPHEVHIHYEGLSNEHYNMTPYKYKKELPVRINPPSFIDFGEGIAACLKEAELELGERKLSETAQSQEP